MNTSRHPNVCLASGADKRKRYNPKKEVSKYFCVLAPRFEGLLRLSFAGSESASSENCPHCQR